MGHDYETFYATTRDALEGTAPWVRTFFAGYAGPRLRVLDVGCGQGRDGLYAAARGHDVLGVDLPFSGIADLLKPAEALPKESSGQVAGCVTGLRDFQPVEDFDLLLINRTLHMLGNKDRAALLTRLLLRLTKDGYILIADEARHMPQILRVLIANEPQIRWMATTRNTLVDQCVAD